MVSTFDLSARVVGSEIPGGGPKFAWPQEHSAAARLSSASKRTRAERREAHPVVLFIGASIKRAANRRAIDRLAATLESPGRADGQSVGVAEGRTDPLILGAKCDAPSFGLHTHAVSESVLGLVVSNVRSGTRFIRRAG